MDDCKFIWIAVWIKSEFEYKFQVIVKGVML